MSVASVFVPHLNTTVKLGRKAPHPDKQVCKLAKYIEHSLLKSSVPTLIDYSPKAAAALARMYLNNQLGCCVVAGESHLVGVRTGNESGTPAVFKDSDVAEFYYRVCGGGREIDEGCVISDVLDEEVKNGIVGHKLAGYVSVDNANKVEVQAAIYLFGGLTLGINLPSSWANNANPGFVWDDTNDSIVGGHEIVVVGYDAQGVKVSTWGMLGTVTWAGLADKNIVTECYASIGSDWVDGSKPAPNGFDLTTLTADLKELGQGSVPDVTPPVPVTPPVVPPVPLTLWQEFEAWLAGLFNHFKSSRGIK